MMRGMLLVVPCAAVGLCSCLGPPPEVYKGEYPVAEVERSVDGKEASASLAPGVAIAEVLDITPFEGFRPGINPVQAETLYGPPVKVEKGKWEESYHFQSGNRIVEVVASKSVSSWDDSRIVTRHVLRVAVDDPRYVDLLPPSIRAVCASAEGEMQLTVVSREAGEPNVWLNVQNGRVQSIVLVPPIPAGLRTPESVPAS